MKKFFEKLKNFLKTAVKNTAVKIFIILILVFMAGFLLLRFFPYKDLSSFRNRDWSTRFYDRADNLCHIAYVDDGIQREFYPIKNFNKDFIFVLLESEDKRFFSHNGVDFKAILRALLQNIKSGETTSGASTITMQLARIISGKTAVNRNIWDKIQEALNAIRLEMRFSKTEILEMYINSVPFGFRTEGFQSASRKFFSKPLNLLNLKEFLCLVTIPRRPNLYSPLENPEANGKAAYRLYKSIKEDLNSPGNSGSTGNKNSGILIQEYTEEDFLATAKSASSYNIPFEFPHLITRILTECKTKKEEYPPDYKLTLSLSAQKTGEKLLNMALQKVSGHRLSNGAVFAMDNRTGEILIWIGSGNFYDSSTNGQIDGVTVFNQPGSSLKPFLYCLALEKGFKPNSILPDIPTIFGTHEVYGPENFNNKFNGPVRLRTALASSLNIPAVYLLNQIGIGEYVETLKKLNFESVEEKSRESGLGIALGNTPVRLLDITTAFSVFTRDGKYISPVYNSEEAAKRKTEGIAVEKVFNQDTARIIAKILSDKSSRVTGFGFVTNFDTEFPSIFKTGTANQFQSITALGASMNYTVGVWMGNFSGETVQGTTGSSMPAAVVKELLTFFEKSEPPESYGKNFPEPENWKKQPVCTLSGKLKTENCPGTFYEYIPVNGMEDECDWHQKDGNQTVTVLPAEYDQWNKMYKNPAEINYGSKPLSLEMPKTGEVYLLDMSVPIEKRGIPLSITGGNKEPILVYYDGVFIGEYNFPYNCLLPLETGKHSIEVISGETKCSATFSVK